MFQSKISLIKFKKPAEYHYTYLSRKKYTLHVTKTHDRRTQHTKSASNSIREQLNINRQTCDKNWRLVAA